jgi:hypothetical protein
MKREEENYTFWLKSIILSGRMIPRYNSRVKFFGAGDFQLMDKI